MINTSNKGMQIFTTKLYVCSSRKPTQKPLAFLQVQLPKCQQHVAQFNYSNICQPICPKHKLFEWKSAPRAGRAHAAPSSSSMSSTPKTVRRAIIHRAGQALKLIWSIIDPINIDWNSNLTITDHLGRGVQQVSSSLCSSDYRTVSRCGAWTLPEGGMYFIKINYQ